PRRPPRSPPFPYTTLFRSRDGVVGEPAEAHRDGRAVERTVLVLEQLPHQRRLGACKHVGRNLAVMLDVAPEQAVEVGDLVDVLRSEEHTSELQSLAYLVCR